MKILYIHQYFKTPDEGGAIRSWYIARAMVASGHEVDMITAHNQAKFKKLSVDGITVHYLPVRYENSFGFLRRLWSFLRFYGRSVRYIPGTGIHDLAYITSTPLTVGLIALRIRKKFNIPYVFEVRDLWPEAPIQAGVMRSAFLKRISRKLELNTYRRAARLVALSPGIFESLNSTVPGKRIHLCTNMSDCEFFTPSQIRDSKLKLKYGIEDELVIAYFGALGQLNSLDYLLDAAYYFQQQNAAVKFLIIGNGGRKKHLQTESEKRDLKNVVFIDHVNKYELREHLTLIDVAYISFASLKVLESNSPNKFFDSLASGKMIVLNISGWLREYIEEYQCGFYTDPQNPEDFYNKIKPFMIDRAKLLPWQNNARLLAERTFERNKLTGDLLKFIGDQ